MDGVTVRTVVNFVTVPPGKELDQEQVMALADQPLSAGMGEVVADAAAEAARQQAQDAARGAVRGLTRGLLGRRRQQEEEPQEEAQPELVQAILMRTTSTVEDLKVGPLGEEIFQAPSDYTQIDPPWTGMGGGV
jgi:hypothetical protein